MCVWLYVHVTVALFERQTNMLWFLTQRNKFYQFITCGGIIRAKQFSDSCNSYHEQPVSLRTAGLRWPESALLSSACNQQNNNAIWWSCHMNYSQVAQKHQFNKYIRKQLKYCNLQTRLATTASSRPIHCKVEIFDEHHPQNEASIMLSLLWCPMEIKHRAREKYSGCSHQVLR